MNKNTFRTVKLEKGEMHIYDGGAVRLHAYKTNDPIDNEVFIVEKDGRAVLPGVVSRKKQMIPALLNAIKEEQE